MRCYWVETKTLVGADAESESEEGVCTSVCVEAFDCIAPDKVTCGSCNIVSILVGCSVVGSDELSRKTSWEYLTRDSELTRGLRLAHVDWC